MSTRSSQQRTYDVAIVGAGIVGSATAYYLAKQGYSVVFLEKGRVAGEQSGRNLGFVREQGRDPREISLMALGKRIWQNLEAELRCDLEWRQGGLLYPAATDAVLETYEDWLKKVRQYGLDSRIVTGDQISALLPSMARKWRGGLYTPSDGQADPVKTTKAFAYAAVSRGADLLHGCSVESICFEDGGQIRLRTNLGKISAGAILIAGGVWSGRLLRTAGINLPQLQVRSTALRTTPVPRFTDLCFWGPAFGFRQQADGSMIIGAGVRCDHELGLDSLLHARSFLSNGIVNLRKIDFHLDWTSARNFRRSFHPLAALRSDLKAHPVLDPAPIQKKAGAAIAGFRELFPKLEVKIASSWAGMIDVTPDEIPILGAVPKSPGLYVATGLSGHGFGIGPAVGYVMSELIAKGRTPVDVRAFSPGRFI